MQAVHLPSPECVDNLISWHIAEWLKVGMKIYWPRPSIHLLTCTLLTNNSLHSWERDSSKTGYKLVIPGLVKRITASHYIADVILLDSLTTGIIPQIFVMWVDMNCAEVAIPVVC